MAKYTYPEDFEGSFWTVIDGDYYVSTIGNDITGDGSPLLPYLTVNKAMELANDGEKVVIGPDEYIQVDQSGALQSSGSLAPCRVATTGHINFQSGGLFTLDGTLVQAGDRVLVWQQNDPTENGIYIVSANPWERATDFNNPENISSGMLIPILEGGSYAHDVFQYTTLGDVIVGTTNLAFERIISENVNWGNIEGDIATQVDLAAALATKADDVSLMTHTSDTANPHGVTKAQVGLANADDTADADKPVSTIQQAALDLKLNNSDIIDDLLSVDSTKVLSANQGSVLKGLIDNINTLLASDDTTLDELQEVVDFIKQNKADLDALGIANIAGLQAALDEKALKTNVLEKDNSTAFTPTQDYHPATKSYVDSASPNVGFGADNQIPIMNTGGTDFEYSSNFSYEDGARLTAKGAGGNSFAAGNLSTASGNSSVGIGFFANASATSAIAIGQAAAAAGPQSMAMGQNASTAATLGGAIAIGTSASTSSVMAIALGASTSITEEGGIGIGRYSQVSAQGAIMMGYHTSVQTNSLSNSFELAWDGITGFKVGNTYGTGVTVNADPDTNLTDAVDGVIAYDSTDHEFRARVNGAWVGLGSGGGTSFGAPNQIPIMNDMGTDFEYDSGFSYDGSRLRVEGDGSNSIAIGDSTTESPTTGSIAIGRQVGISPSGTVNDYFIGIGDSAASGSTQNIGANSIAIGRNSISEAESGVALGNSASARGMYTISIGYIAGSNWGQVDSGESINIGYNANGGNHKIGNRSIGIGRDTESSGGNSVAISYQAEASGSFSIALGNQAIADSTGSIALGAYCESQAQRMISVGYNAGDSTGTINNENISIGYNTNAGSNDIGLGSIAIGRSVNASAQGAIIMGYHSSVQSNSLSNSFELAWDGATQFKVGATYGTGITVNADPDTNLVDAVDGVIAYDSTDHEFRAFVNGGWTGLGGGTEFPYIVDDASTNSVIEIAEFRRTSSGMAANGIGGYLNLSVQAADSSVIPLLIIHELTDAGTGVQDSGFRIKGYVGGVAADLIRIKGGSIESIAIGNGTSGDAGHSIAIGSDATTSSSAIAIGHKAGTATGFYNSTAVSIGSHSNAGTSDIGIRSISIGQYSESSGGAAIALGYFSKAHALGTISLGQHSNASVPGAIMMGYHTSAQTNSLSDSFELAWNGITGFKTGLTYGTGITTNADPDTNLVDAVDGVIAYDSTDHEFRAFVNGGWTSLGGGGVSQNGTTFNDQVAVWAGDGTVEGNNNFKFQSGNNTLLIGGVSTYNSGASVSIGDNNDSRSIITGGSVDLKYTNASEVFDIDFGFWGLTHKVTNGSSTRSLSVNAISGMDTGIIPAIELKSQLTDSSALSNRPTLAGYNYSTKQWEVGADGTWNYQGNEIENVSQIIVEDGTNQRGIINPQGNSFIGTNEKSTTIAGVSNTSGSETLNLTSLVTTGNDTGNIAATVLMARIGGAALSTRPTLAGYNFTTKQWEVAADGNWDYQGNDLNNIHSVSVVGTDNTALLELRDTSITNGCEARLQFADQSQTVGFVSFETSELTIANELNSNIKFKINGSDRMSINGWAGNLDLKNLDLIGTGSNTPASATATGVRGTITWDTNYIYICTATDTWKRVAIASW
ncbi:hypothetical protein [Reichenbachiella sp.]